MLIYNTITKELERFEPYGEIQVRKYKTNVIEYTNKIKNVLVSEFNKHIRMVEHFISPLDFCPIFSFQKIQEQENQRLVSDPVGFCLVWIVWYADIRLLNPLMERNELVSKALSTLKENPETFTEYIRNYSVVFVKLYNKVTTSKFRSFDALAEYYKKILSETPDDKIFEVI